MVSFHSNTFTDFKALTADVVIVIDSKWRDRFSDRTQEDILLAKHFRPKTCYEYTGLAKFSPKVSRWIINNKTKYDPHSNFIDLLDDIRVRI